jgi:LysR family transcriptional regulator, hydrogen peroxide-inducible genes activator
MEFHQLRYVAAVARCGNFTRAAAQCHVSQPSLSQQIHKLEEELGEKLFERLKRTARLTAVGGRFLAHAERVLLEADAAQREAKSGQGPLRGPLLLGALPTIAPYLLPPRLAAFNARYPAVEIVVQEDTTAALLRQLTDCELDLAIASLPIHDARFSALKLFDEELVLALPPGHRLLARARIRLGDLERERFILMKEGHCLGEQVLHFCHRVDFHPQISCRSAQIETVQAFVRAGLGISLVPRMAVNPDAGTTPVYRSLAKPMPKRAICAIWLKQRSPNRVVTAFLDHLAGANTQ